MANTRIKIRREDLIAKLNESRDALVLEFEANTKAYWSGVGATAVAIKTALKELMKLNQTDLIDATDIGYQNIARVNIGEMEIPREPVLKTHELDKMIRVLESSCEDTISVTVGDAYARYL